MADRGYENGTQNAVEESSDDFHETLSQPIPNRTYRSQSAETYPTLVEQLVTYVAVVLDVLLAVRFITSLFTTDTSNAFVGFVYRLTNWVVAPFQAFFGQTPTGNTGYFDWPALAAIVVVPVIASLVVRLLRSNRGPA